MTLDDHQIAAFLAHGAMAQHFAADDQVSAHIVQIGLSPLKHVDPAIDARIGAASITKLRATDHVEIGVFFRQDRERHIQ